MTTIHQIYITNDDSPLPDRLQAFRSTIQEKFVGDECRLYNNSQLREIIYDYAGTRIGKAYDTLTPYSYKADLGRFVLLHYFGGWYFDIGVRAHNGVEVDANVEFLAFRDIQRFSLTTYACATTVLYSKPSSPILEAAIEMIADNCDKQFYGITPLCPTGPTLLGKAIASVEAKRFYVFGDYLELTPNHHQVNRAFVLPDGTILAWSKPAGGGDLTALGGSGVNNYNHLWNQRAVYKHE